MSCAPPMTLAITGLRMSARTKRDGTEVTPRRYDVDASHDRVDVGVLGQPAPRESDHRGLDRPP